MNTSDTAIPETMRAVVLTGLGDLDKLQYHTDWPTPKPGDGDVLVRVLACGLNNTDVNTRTGWYSKGVTGSTTGSSLTGADDDDAAWGGSPLKFPLIQGADVCGTVVATGNGADSSLMGKRVLIDTWFRDWDDPHNRSKCRYFGSECNGGFAEFTVAPAHQVHPVTSNLTDAELATFATAYVTAENMLSRASVGAGDVVLIPGASGGVGSALLQLAARRGATTIALCGDTKRDQVKAIGAHAVLPRAPDNLRAALRDAVGRDTVNVVADVVGGRLWPRLIDVLARGGRYTCSGAIAGPIVELDLRTLYLNDLSFTGATIVPPGMFANLVSYIEKGEIRPLLAGTYPLEKLHEAQAAFVAKRHVGNIVVQP